MVDENSGRGAEANGTDIVTISRARLDAIRGRAERAEAEAAGLRERVKELEQEVSRFWKPETDAEIERMLASIPNEPLPPEKAARMLRKIRGEEPVFANSPPPAADAGKGRVEAWQIINKTTTDKHTSSKMWCLVDGALWERVPTYSFLSGKLGWKWKREAVVSVETLRAWEKEGLVISIAPSSVTPPPPGVEGGT